MPGSSNSVDDDDNAASLMPNVAKLIRVESDPLESSGSTSMSLCGISENDKIETQDVKSSGQRGETVFRDVANKFLRRGATGQRSTAACKPSAFNMLPYNRVGSPFADKRNAYVFEKEKLRPKSATLVNQVTLQRKMAIRDISQKAAREFRRHCTRSVVKLGERRTADPRTQGADKSEIDMFSEHLSEHAATPEVSHVSQGSEESCYVSKFGRKGSRGKAKLNRRALSLNLSELEEKFAEIDGEALEEEEVSIVHLTTITPVLTLQTLLQHADGIPENVVGNGKDLPTSARENKVSATLNPSVEGTTLPNYSHGQGQEGIGICTSQSKLSKTPRRDQPGEVSEATCEGNAQANAAASRGTDWDGINRPSSRSGCLDLDDSRVALSKANSGGQGCKRSSQFASKTAARQQVQMEVHRKVTQLEISEPQNMCVDEVVIEMESVHPRPAEPIPFSVVVSQHADRNERNNVRCRNEESTPHFEEDAASPSMNGMAEDKARTVDMQTFPIPLDASAQEFGAKGTSVHPVFELEHAEDSCNDKRGYSSLKPNEENDKEMAADGADADASHLEETVLGHTPTSGEALLSAPSKAMRLLEQEGVPDIPLQGGIHSTGDTSATPPRNPILLTCLSHYSRFIGGSIVMNQRRLVFDSSTESLPKQKVVDKRSDDVSVSTVECKGRTDPAVFLIDDEQLEPVGDPRQDAVGVEAPVRDVADAAAVPVGLFAQTDILNHDIHEHDANMTSTPHQEAKLPIPDDEVIGHVDDGGCRSQSSQANAATNCEDVHLRETPLTGLLTEDSDLPAFEASREIVEEVPEAEQATEIPKARRLGKRTWANLGDPIDGGTEWKEGMRVSTRIKSRPLEWWRGEKMLYGRVHSTLCTLIGIKTSAPDPFWPRPKPKRGDYSMRNFHVHSFVGDSHRDLLRLAAE